MANPKHVAMLKRSVEELNRWRDGHRNQSLDLSEADLTEFELSTADLSRANLSGTDLSYTLLGGTDFLEADLSKAVLTYAALSDATLFGAKLVGANCAGAIFSGSNLIHAKLTGADLSEASFFRADLTDADLSRATLAVAAFAYAKLTRANLTGANLRGADLTQANLVNANLTRADLTNANLTGANLRGADLTQANLANANLSRADLTHANLIGATFRDAMLDRADFQSAILGQTTFANIDFGKTKGLETVLHSGPSTIGIDTIYRSGGKIPKRFLLGLGVPDSLIAQIPALVGALEGIRSYSFLISYGHKDEKFCKRLHSRMQQQGLRAWLASEDMPWGKKLGEEIETQIRLHDKLLLVLSPASMNSEWVSAEIYHARQRESEEKRKVLFPVALCSYAEIREWKCFHAETGKDMAREIREYANPDDFTSWRDEDAFERAFSRLLMGLETKHNTGGGWPPV